MCIFVVFMEYFRHKYNMAVLLECCPLRDSVAHFHPCDSDSLISGQMIQFSQLLWLILLVMLFNRYLSFVEGFHGVF